MNGFVHISAVFLAVGFSYLWCLVLVILFGAAEFSYSFVLVFSHYSVWDIDIIRSLSKHGLVFIYFGWFIILSVFLFLERCLLLRTCCFSLFTSSVRF